MQRCLLIWFFVFAFVSAKAQNDTVVFSDSGGFYEEVFALQLFNTNPQNHIRYTINGNRPTAQSALYEEPIVLDGSNYSKSDIYTIQISPDNLVYVPDSIQHCIVIRAAAFDENDSCVSAVTTNSYFIRALGCDTHGLPAVSLCADSLDLFDYERGIMVPGVFFDSLNPQQSGNYYQKGIEWERLVNVEYRDYSNNNGINQPCGLRAHGNRARRQPQKGLKIYAREEYGKKRFNYRFFEDCPYNSFKHLVLKSFSTLYPNTSIQDYICCQTALDMGLEAGQSRPVVLFLNGEYWGIYFLQEKMDERFLEDHFNIDIEHCNIVGNWNGLAEHGGPINAQGNNEEFAELMDWLDTTDLSQEQNYRRLGSLIDVDNFMDYIIFETFVANNDWPSNNMRCWKMDRGRWRWIFFDGDAALNSYGVDSYGNPTPLDVFGNATYSGNFNWPSSEKATRLFRRCLENERFVSAFESRMSELCREVLTYENMSRYYFHIKELLTPEIGPQSFRFGNPDNFDFWNWACTLTDDFLINREETYAQEWSRFMDVDENMVIRSLFCYPNPFSDKIHIIVNAERKESKEIAIYDMMGRKVFATTCGDCEGSNEIILHPALPAGVYVMRVGAYSTKIVKM
jgi:hypothetical protein